ncbi:MAG: M48 family metallopeptidase [Clostridia bacterium]|nr:M48 family metallopeptidase [Clostridia bacterium]
MRNEVITYSVNKTNDRELYISVQNGEVLVRAPWYVTREKIQEAVANKKNWIMKKLKEYKEENEISLRPIQIMGIVYNLKVSYKNINVIECNMEDDIIKVNFPKKYKKIDNEVITDMLIDKMYFKIAERELENIMEKTRITLGFAPEDYEIVEMKDCLAKCTDDKRILINPRIIKYKREVIEYIAMHEFCHLKYKNHTKSFYNMLEKYMPDYKKYELKNVKY